MNKFFIIFLFHFSFTFIYSIDLRYATELDFLEKYIGNHFKYNIQLENKKNEMEKAYLLNLRNSNKTSITIHVAGKIKENVEQELEIYLAYNNITKKNIPEFYDRRKFENYFTYELEEPLQFEYYIVMKNCKTIIVNGYDENYKKPQKKNEIILNSENLPYFPFTFIFNRNINQIIKIDITNYKYNEENLFKFFYFQKDNLNVNYKISIKNELEFSQNNKEIIEKNLLLYKNESGFFDDFFVGNSLEINNTFLFMRTHLNLRPLKLKSFINIEFNATVNEKFNSFGLFGFILNEMVKNYTIDRNKYLNNQKIVLKMFKHHNIYNISYFKIKDFGNRNGDYYINFKGKFDKINSFYFGNFLINSTNENPFKNNYKKINESCFMINGKEFQEFKKKFDTNTLCLIGFENLKSDVDVFINVVNNNENNKNKKNKILKASVNLLIICFVIIFLYIIKNYKNLNKKRVNKFIEYNDNNYYDNMEVLNDLE
jgi:hypothetical protein